MNTKVWAGQTIERASQKSVRLSAWDGEEGIKVFLIMVSTKYTSTVYSATQSCLVNSRSGLCNKPVDF